MSEFVHLHVHSEYSLLDGANRIKDLPVRAKELGMDAIALTDHGVMYGAVDFFEECDKNGVKPIIGCEVYVAPRTRFDKEPNLDANYSHLILLVKNKTGYENLIKLVSIGFIDGFYYKPRIDLESLEKYHEGLICLSACLAGSVNQEILKGNIEKAKEVALWHKNIFKEDYYLEIQNNGIKEQVLANQKLFELSKELDIPLVATNDAHYLKREDSYNHEVLLCIQTGKKITDEDRMKFETDELYIKSSEEMEEYFKNIPESISNTKKIADKCDFKFEFGNTKLPNYEVPKEYKTHLDYFKKLCYDGVKERYNIDVEIDVDSNSLPTTEEQQILERMQYEISVIDKMGYIDYFLIVWDFIHYAKENGIPVGPGRGSGAGSIAAYAIGITDIDPIKYELIFERFLNPERISMPDFDIDFCYERRPEVIEYVARKYGQDHVAQIITFGTMSARMVIRDVGRALDVPYADVDKLAKMIPFELHMTIAKALEQNRELKEVYELDENSKRIIDISLGLEGLPRHASTHAAGVVITKDPVDTYVPLYIKDENVSTQYTMTILEKLGLLKMDFLGLRTLTVIQDAINLVKKTKGIDVKFDKDMSDPKVFKLWQEGKTSGIFQFESAGMTSFMKELKPDTLEDIIAGVSLYRPGPMDQIPRYIRNKLNPEHIEYTHMSLEPYLKVTYGCMVYQEQVMQIFRGLGGYSLGRADLVRKAMGKKKLDVMAEEREVFINGEVDENGNVKVAGCVRNGIEEPAANKIFDEMAEFAKYAFNKSHAAAYAVVSYQTAFLKAYYPEEFMAATLNSFLGNLDKVPEYIYECKQMGIEILRPDINKSYTKFTVDNGKIRFGLGSIKNVGIAAVDNIVLEREKNGDYKDFADFCERMQGETVNKKCIESLIKAGSFDNLGATRSTLLASFEGILDTISGEGKRSIEGQFNMFSMEENMLDAGEQPIQKYNYNVLEEYPTKQLLSMEKEMIGLYISGHPLEQYKEEISSQTNINNLQINEIKEQLQNMNENTLYKDGDNVKYAGIISRIKKKYTKNNTIMAFVAIEDLYGECEAIVFDRCYNRCSNLIMEENIVLVEGKLSIREDQNITIVANEIKSLSSKKRKTLTINITDLSEDTRNKLKGAIRFFTGDKSNIDLQIQDGNETKPAGGMYLTDEIKTALEEIVGEDRVNIM